MPGVVEHDGATRREKRIQVLVGGHRRLLEQAVEALEITHSAGVLHLTVSAGLAQHRTGDTIDHTLERADQALYTAKALGRNRVVMMDNPTLPSHGRTP